MYVYMYRYVCVSVCMCVYCVGVVFLCVEVVLTLFGWSEVWNGGKTRTARNQQTSDTKEGRGREPGNGGHTKIKIYFILYTLCRCAPHHVSFVWCVFLFSGRRGWFWTQKFKSNLLRMLLFHCTRSSPPPHCPSPLYALRCPPAACLVYACVLRRRDSAIGVTELTRLRHQCRPTTKTRRKQGNTIHHQTTSHTHA